MMCQKDFEQQQQQQSQIGLIREKIQQSISQIPKIFEQRRLPIGLESMQQSERIGLQQGIEKDQIIQRIKTLICQVYDMLIDGEQQCDKTEQEELLKQIRDLQCQIKGLIGCEQTTETCDYEIIPSELCGDCKPTKLECERQMTIQLRKQMIENITQQIRIFEDILIEKLYDMTYQMSKMEEFSFEIERELFEQIKRKFSELEQQMIYGYQQELEMKLRKSIDLIKQHIQQIDEIMCTICGQTKYILRARELCQQILDRIRKFRGLMQEICLMICQETEMCENTQTQMESMTKMMESINCAGEKEISRNIRQVQETEQITTMKKEFEEIRMIKQDLEMRLNEINRKIQNIECQICEIEKCPKQETEMNGECTTKPEIFQCGMRIMQQQQQQPTWYTSTEPKCDMMMIKSRTCEHKPQEKMSKFYL